MVGPSLHKGTRIDPAARAPQDHIKLALVPVFLATKEPWATEPETLGPCHLGAACAEKPHRTLPAPCTVAPTFAAEMTPAPRGAALRRNPSTKSGRRRRQLAQAWSPETTRVQLGLSSPKSGTGVSPVRASEVNCRPQCGEDEREGTKALSHWERDEPRRPV